MGGLPDRGVGHCRVTWRVRSVAAGGRLPHPGLGQVTALTAMAREAGLDIKLEVTTLSTAPLPSAVDHTAYRILQESITNVIRHVGPTRVTIELDYGTDVLEVRVADE